MSNKDNNVLIKIPEGEGCMCYFQLTPDLPDNNGARGWMLTETSPNKKDKVNNVLVSFSEKSSASECTIEQCVLVVNIDDSVQTDSSAWRFVLDGIQYCEGSDDNLHDINTEISSNGKILTITIKSLTKIAEKVSYSFVAMHTDKHSGECKIYESSDPGIGIGRPR